MSKMVYDEWYGELTVAQRNAYRKFNVSPSDHDFLTDAFGEADHDVITRFVKDHAADGMYRQPMGMYNLAKSRVTGEIRTTVELQDIYNGNYNDWVPLTRSRA